MVSITMGSIFSPISLVRMKNYSVSPRSEIKYWPVQIHQPWQVHCKKKKKKSKMYYCHAKEASSGCDVSSHIFLDLSAFHSDVGSITYGCPSSLFFRKSQVTLYRWMTGASSAGFLPPCMPLKLPLTINNIIFASRMRFRREFKAKGI